MPTFFRAHRNVIVFSPVLFLSLLFVCILRVEFIFSWFCRIFICLPFNGRCAAGAPRYRGPPKNSLCVCVCCAYALNTQTVVLLWAFHTHSHKYSYCSHRSHLVLLNSRCKIVTFRSHFHRNHERKRNKGKTIGPEREREIRVLI